MFHSFFRNQIVLDRITKEISNHHDRDLSNMVLDSEATDKEIILRLDNISYGIDELTRLLKVIKSCTAAVPATPIKAKGAIPEMLRLAWDDYESLPKMTAVLVKDSTFTGYIRFDVWYAKGDRDSKTIDSPSAIELYQAGINGSPGSFEHTLYELFYKGGYDNRRRLAEAFPEFFSGRGVILDSVHTEEAYERLLQH